MSVSVLLFESAGAPRQLWRSLCFKTMCGAFGGFHAFQVAQSSTIGGMSTTFPVVSSEWRGSLQVRIAADAFLKGVVALDKLMHLQRSLPTLTVLLFCY